MDGVCLVGFTEWDFISDIVSPNNDHKTQTQHVFPNNDHKTQTQAMWVSVGILTADT